MIERAAARAGLCHRNWTICRSRYEESAPSPLRRSSAAIASSWESAMPSSFRALRANKRKAAGADISYHTLRGYLRPAAKRRGRPPALALEEGPPSPPWIESTSDPGNQSPPTGEES